MHPHQTLKSAVGLLHLTFHPPPANVKTLDLTSYFQTTTCMPNKKARNKVLRITLKYLSSGVKITNSLAAHRISEYNCKNEEQPSRV